MAYGSIAPPPVLAPLPTLSFPLTDELKLTTYPVTGHQCPQHLIEYLYEIFSEELAGRLGSFFFLLLPVDPALSIREIISFTKTIDISSSSERASERAGGIERRTERAGKRLIRMCAD